MTNPMTTGPTDQGAQPTLIALVWLWVAVPFAYGIWELFTKITQLFTS